MIEKLRANTHRDKGLSKASDHCVTQSRKRIHLTEMLITTS
jgi:hypothetical protein